MVKGNPIAVLLVLAAVIVGFRVDCNPMLARGTYYVYLDDLRAVTDLYDVENRDEDDMHDDW